MNYKILKIINDGNNEFKAAHDLMSVLSKLHDWEINNIPCMQTISGRMLYLSVSKNIMNAEIAKSLSMKSLFNSNILTEKALRNRALKMKMDGILEIKKGSDARSRVISPTASLKSINNEHCNQFISIISEKFYLIPK